MDALQNLIEALMVLIPIGGAARGVLCALGMLIDDEQYSIYKRRLRNMVRFVVISECVAAILGLVIRYVV